GVYRSDDSGATWRRLSGAGAGHPGSGLPDLPVFDLASFAVNATTVGFYTAVPPTSGGGVFRSLDNGNTWQAINVGINVLAQRIVLSVSPAAGKTGSAGGGGCLRGRVEREPTSGGGPWD